MAAAFVLGSDLMIQLVMVTSLQAPLKIIPLALLVLASMVMPSNTILLLLFKIITFELTEEVTMTSLGLPVADVMVNLYLPIILLELLKSKLSL